MQVEKAHLIVAIIADVAFVISSIVGLPSNKIGLIISIIVAIVTLLITVLLYLQLRQQRIRENLISFLLFKNEKRQFNFLPKTVVYMNIREERNEVSIDNVVIKSEYFMGGNNKETKITWELNTVRSSSKKDISSYYLYCGIDTGKITRATVSYKANGVKENLRLDDVEVNNGVRLLCAPTNGYLKNGECINQIKFEQESQDAFDFSKDELLFFIPTNYGETINHVTIYIVFHGIEKMQNMNAELHEIARCKTSWKDKCITSRSKVAEKEDGDGFEFNISKKYIHMDSIYYVILKKNYEEEQ